jgi:5-methylcytosine-specific restriction enzyme subunit McrC
MTVHTIELQEHMPCLLPAEALSQQAGKHLWSHYGEKIHIEPPSFMTNNCWRLTPQGWVGLIPVDESVHLLIAPKVELGNLFRMLEYAYKLEFLASGDMVGAKSMKEFYERLAKVLAMRILDRSRKGLYRAYKAQSHQLPYLRGKLVLESMLRTAWETSLDCQYYENTADIEDNQILAWTLYCMARSGFCREDVARLVRRAFRATQGIAELKSCSSRLCSGRQYNRLNEDYRPLHLLCRFFLDHSGPFHEKGRDQMLPFLVEMARLFEMFVAEWLRQHLPDNIVLKDQAVFRLGSESKIDFHIDLLLTDRHSGKTLCLLDTKYKTPASPSASDVEQVIAYAKAIGSPEAVLVYPQSLPKPFDSMVGGDIHVCTMTFAIAGDLESQGQAFLAALMERIHLYTPQL